ncbi:MAG: endonuclease domain-containing protein [Armatimonadota bacterium]
MTPAERRLWEYLRANWLNGYHFQRQQVIGGFVVDFYCHALRLAVEVDGEVHEASYDADRDRLLAEYGVNVAPSRISRCLITLKPC